MAKVPLRATPQTAAAQLYPVSDGHSATVGPDISIAAESYSLLFREEVVGGWIDCGGKSSSGFKVAVLR